MDAWQTLLTALGGALIGAASSIAAIFIQARYQAQRDRLKVIGDVAIAEHSHSLQLAQTHAGLPVWPLFLSIAYHAAIFRIVEQRDLTSEDIKNLNEKTNALYQVVREESDRLKGRPHDAKPGMPY